MSVSEPPPLPAPLALRVRDGRALVLRPVRPSDKALFREAFARLSDESRYLRFLAPLARLSDADLAYLTEVDSVRHVAWCALETQGGRERLVGVARFVRDAADPSAAEAAAVVTDAEQDQGIGKALMAVLAALAHRHGVTTFTAQVAGSNRKVEAMLLKLGARYLGRDQDLSRYSLDVPHMRATLGDPFP